MRKSSSSRQPGKSPTPVSLDRMEPASEAPEAVPLSASVKDVDVDAPAHAPGPRDQVAALAHRLWESEGKPEGKELDHWNEAERQLRRGS